MASTGKRNGRRAGKERVAGPSCPTRIDPLAALRGPDDPAWDVYLTGTVFLDIVFTGLDSAPVRGTESWARGMGSSPGGVANMATALARLGLRTSLAAAFGDDHYGEYCWDALEQGEGIDLSPSRTIPGWHSPVTVSMAYEGERTMVSHGHEPPPRSSPPTPRPPPPSRNALRARTCPRARPRAGRRRLPHPRPQRPWIARAARNGTRIFGDVGWDDTGAWDLANLHDLRHCEAFLPNAAEAMRYTGTDTPRAAAHALAEHVPVVVVTLGAEGAYAVDRRTGRPRRSRPSKWRRWTRPGRVTSSSPASSPAPWRAGPWPTGSPSPDSRRHCPSRSSAAPCPPRAGRRSPPGGAGSSRSTARTPPP